MGILIVSIFILVAIIAFRVNSAHDKLDDIKEDIAEIKNNLDPPG